MKRIRLVLYGQVQGVGLRYAVRLQAHKQRLRGWVRNELDGTVQLVIQGNNQEIDVFLRWIRHCGIGKIDRLDVNQEDPTETLADFSIQ